MTFAMFLLPNSTHLCQPITTRWCLWTSKDRLAKSSNGLENGKPLKERLAEGLFPKTSCSINESASGKSGYRKSGIYPLDRTKVLDQLPSRDSQLKPKQAIFTAATVSQTQISTPEDDFCSNESDDNFEVQVLQEIESKRIEEEELEDVEGNVRTGIWVLVEGKNKKSTKHYIGQVTKVDRKGGPEVRFLKKT
ncbi:hypothetical protein PR048_008202 [Dryococelus australis]|uniref:Uncharacterized protein n=1 Tax=Dryococelus australis TaxID=614101 RepID=A0ABQ9HWI9_9NEOP|nr:hypothetical protein PR048_008202 [Dryococelus australis]